MRNLQLSSKGGMMRGFAKTQLRRAKKKAPELGTTGAEIGRFVGKQLPANETNARLYRYVSPRKRKALPTSLPSLSKVGVYELA